MLGRCALKACVMLVDDWPVERGRLEWLEAEPVAQPRHGPAPVCCGVCALEGAGRAQGRQEVGQVDRVAGERVDSRGADEGGASVAEVRHP